ncbi:MAG: septum formation initiator family protein [Frankiaceae bacterium]|nr:septum formation initiator family protein [Frankiaceae bacterium]MBV9870080.1 septum formation initiator family protein [Frankiaceae bacterium]
MSSGGAAGRRPGQKRPAPTRSTRSRAAEPTRRPKREDVEEVGRQTTLTARAAILVLAVASVMVAVALPLKIWLGQRSDIAGVSAQIKKVQAHIAQLDAQHKRWNDPGYIEQQARQRLHYVMPGQKSYIVLGKGHRVHAAAARHEAAPATGPWYSQFWQSVETAGTPTPSK